MNPDTRNQVENAIEQTKKAEEQLDKIEDVSLEQAEQIARRYTKESSSTLVGIVGAIAGGTGGVALTAAVGTTLIVTGPLGAAAGAALAILAWRGKKHWQLERETAKLELALAQIRKQLKALPDDAPPEVRQKWWDIYLRLQSKFENSAADALESGDLNAPSLPRGLPAGSLPGRVDSEDGE
jgi:hypothetical protein